MDFTIIAAMDSKRGIGRNNDLSWHIPADMKHFVSVTTGGTVIMGRRTWESIPPKFRPFKNRQNIILTRDPEYKIQTGVELASSLDEALKIAKEETFIIGGAKVFEESIQHPKCKRLILTEIQSFFDCDVFFPELPAHFQKTEESELHNENNIEFKFVTYESKVDSA